MSEVRPCLLDVQDLHVRCGTFALREVAFSISEGECFVLLGHSGSGKTTLLKTIAGLRRNQGGTIHLRGKPIGMLPPEERNIAYVPQDYALFPHLTVLKNLTLACEVRKIAPSAVREKIRQIVAMLRIEPLLQHRSNQLSGGEKQRVALGRALMMDPQLLILDEPLSALDASLQRSVRSELRKMLRELSMTSLIVTHDCVDAFTLGDRVAVMEEGRIVQVDAPAALLQKPRSQFVADFVGVNFFRGVVAEGVGHRKGVQLHGYDIFLEGDSPCVGDVFVTFFPAEVELSESTEEAAPSAGALLRGTIESIVPLGERVRMQLSEPLPLLAEMPLSAGRLARLREGDQVCYRIPAKALRVYQ
ncbi:MAG: ABC transporter ATP-binding protein [Armatimonadetes bacterium]|nr:ABC transporter ATP-binding protein [Armatimonadota bacterium]